MIKYFLHKIIFLNMLFSIDSCYDSRKENEDIFISILQVDPSRFGNVISRLGDQWQYFIKDINQ